MTEQELREENSLLKTRVFDFRVQLELILEKPSQELKMKERIIKDIIMHSDTLDAFMKHDVNTYIDEELSYHPLLQFYDKFFGIFEQTPE